MATVTNFANAFETTLTADMLGTDLTAQVQTTDGAPSSPCYLVIDPHNDDKREYVLFDGSFTTTSFVTTALANRYLGGSAAASGITHAAGAIVRFAPVAQHFQNIQNSAVWLDEAQTITGAKTFSTATDFATADIDKMRAKNSPWFDVTHPDYGAVGDGVADDTAAIQAAIDAANAASTAGSSTEGVAGSTSPSGGKPTVYLPNGRYKITSALTAGAYINMLGRQAIIFSTDALVDLLTGLGFQAYISGLSFRGGRRHISIATGNVNSCVHRITDCEFDSPAAEALFSDTTSGGGTQTLVERCRFRLGDSTTTSLLRWNSGDFVKIADSWVQGWCERFFRVAGGSKLILDNVLGVPEQASGDATVYWVHLEGRSSLLARGSRFGGESSGRSLVLCDATPDLASAPSPNSIKVRDCDAYCSARPLIRFNDIPNHVEIEGITGLINNATLFAFAAAIPTATKLALGGDKIRIEVDGTPVVIGGHVQQGADPFTERQYLGQHEKVTPAADVASHIRSIAAFSGGFSPSQTISNVTLTATTNLWGHDTREIAATADGANYRRDYTLALDGFAAGTYNFAVEVEPVDRACRVNVHVTDKDVAVPVPPGRHVINIPFNYDAALASNKRVGLYIGDLVNTQVVRVGYHRIYATRAQQNHPVTRVYGTAAPTAGDWLRGDIVYAAQPAASGYLGWVCVATGSPGTWKTFGAISA